MNTIRTVWRLLSTGLMLVCVTTSGANAVIDVCSMQSKGLTLNNCLQNCFNQSGRWCCKNGKTSMGTVSYSCPEGWTHQSSDHTCVRENGYVENSGGAGYDYVQYSSCEATSTVKPGVPCYSTYNYSTGGQGGCAKC